MNTYDTAELYRQIGKRFRQKGADRVILLRSRKYPEKAGMELVIAADGTFQKEELQNESKSLWPDVEITILDLKEDIKGELLEEAIEDGILL